MRKLIERIGDAVSGPRCGKCGKRHSRGGWSHLTRSLQCHLAERRKGQLAIIARQNVDRIPKRLMAVAILLTVTACGRSVTAPPQCVAWTSRTDSVPLYRVSDSSVVGYMTAQNPVCFRWEVQ